MGAFEISLFFSIHVTGGSERSSGHRLRRRPLHQREVYGASSVTAMEFEKLRQRLLDDEICMIFLLIRLLKIS